METLEKVMEVFCYSNTDKLKQPEPLVIYEEVSHCGFCLYSLMSDESPFVFYWPFAYFLLEKCLITFFASVLIGLFFNY